MTILLPATDAGAFAQAGFVLVVGGSLLVWTLRRRATNAAWLVAGVSMALLGFFALRTYH